MSISIARTESQSSRGSAASGTSAGGISIAGGRGRDSLGADAEGVDQTGALRTAVYGLLFTLSRERWDFNKRWVAARLALEHAQLIVFMLQPQFLWALGYKRRWWIYVGAIIFKPLPALVNPRHPYAASIQMFYAFVALVLAALVGCVFVGGAFLRNGACPPKTRVVRLLRFGCGVLFSTAYVGVLLVLASPINCQFLAADPAKRMRLHDFPTVACAQMPHWPHAAVSMLTVVAAAALSALLSAPHAFWAMGDRHPLAAAHPYVELKAWFFKTVMVLASVLLTGHPQVQPIVIAIAAVWLSYIYIRWEPHYNAWANHLRAALYAAAAAIACVAVALSWPLQRDSPPYQRLLTIVALAAAPAAAAAAGAASWLRVQWGPERAVRAFRWADPADLEGPALKSIHRFPDAFEAELASRVARARAGPWPDSDIDREAAALGEVVLKAALMRFDRSAALCLAHAGLMADLQGNAAGAQSQVQAAKKLDPDWFERYAIFVREQQHMARLQGQQGASSAESALDLAGYVEFNRSYKALLRVHKSALRSIRNFWRNLLRTDVAFADMTRSLMKIDLTRQRADRSYKMLLERYPSNVKRGEA